MCLQRNTSTGSWESGEEAEGGVLDRGVGGRKKKVEQELNFMMNPDPSWRAERNDTSLLLSAQTCAAFRGGASLSRLIEAVQLYTGERDEPPLPMEA